MQSHFQHCLKLIKPTQHYAPILFLPEASRDAASAIYAFKAEIDKVPQLVSEPMMGEVRLQWWSDVISGDRAGEAQANPISKALLEVIEEHDLPLEGFARFLEAKLFDLYNDPMPDMEMFETYCGETHSFLLQSMAICLGAERTSQLADACGHGGVAIGIADTVTNMTAHTAKQQIYIPRSLLEGFGLNTTFWLADDYTEQHRKAFKQFCQDGLDHIDKAISAIKKLDRKYHSSFLSLCNARQTIRGYLNFKGDPRKEMTSISPIAKQWVLWKGAVFGI